MCISCTIVQSTATGWMLFLRQTFFLPGHPWAGSSPCRRRPFRSRASHQTPRRPSSFSEGNEWEWFWEANQEEFMNTDGNWNKIYTCLIFFPLNLKGLEWSEIISSRHSFNKRKIHKENISTKRKESNKRLRLKMLSHTLYNIHPFDVFEVWGSLQVRSTSEKRSFKEIKKNITDLLYQCNNATTQQAEIFFIISQVFRYHHNIWH